MNAYHVPDTALNCKYSSSQYKKGSSSQGDNNTLVRESLCAEKQANTAAYDLVVRKASEEALLSKHLNDNHEKTGSGKSIPEKSKKTW